jgi:hypothetical protein
MPLYVWLVILNPIWVTILALIALIWLLSWTGLWARHKYQILAALIALYAIDAVIALPRVLFSHGLPNHLVVAQKVPLPRQLMLVDVPCWAKCHELLISGAIEEIVFVETRRAGDGKEEPRAVRYRAAWTNPGACPRDRQKAIYYLNEGLLKTGYCPVIEPVDVPSQGIFLVWESMIVPASERARNFSPAYLTKSPLGAVIEFVGIEVQNRNGSCVTVLASTYKYEAPGLLGLPPLLGCWARPDNVIWIMPPGDTGCGLWRWFTGGGNERVSSAPERLYDGVFKDVFGPPDRLVVPPEKT